MYRISCWWTVLLTVPFGLAALVAQVPIWTGGLANGQILGTIGGHVVGVVLAGVALTRQA